MTVRRRLRLVVPRSPRGDHLRMQQRRAMMALAPATVQRMPARLSRARICLQPASTTPDEMHWPLARNCG